MVTSAGPALVETDLVLGHALFDAALEVDLGPRVVSDAHHDDAPERVVGLAVATLMGPELSALLARTLRDGRHRAEVSPGGL
jgi:hypothetical protein